MQSEAYGGVESVRPDRRVARGWSRRRGDADRSNPRVPRRSTAYEESTATAGGLGSGERLAPRADGSAAMPEAMTKAVVASEADARVADAALESRTERPAVLEEHMALPEVVEGMVAHAVRHRARGGAASCGGGGRGGRDRTRGTTSPSCPNPPQAGRRSGGH